MKQQRPIMMLRRDKVIELMNTYCGGNYNQFARELGVPVSNLYNFMQTSYGGGTKMIGAVARFCKEKGLDFEDYIEL